MFAYIITHEKPTLGTCFCCVALVVGTVLVFVDWTQKFQTSIAGLIINLAAAVASGLMIVLVRRAVLRLRVIDPSINVLEISFLKGRKIFSIFYL